MLELLMDSIISVFGNAILFGTVPLIWWFIFHRKKEKLGAFMGLYKPERKAAWWILIVFIVIYLLNYFYTEQLLEIFMSEETISMLRGDGTTTDPTVGAGLAGLLPVIITAYICNGFFEEFLYRGFILKRLKNFFDNGILATAITAVAFGLMHNLLYIVGGIPVGIGFHIGIFIYTMLGALLLGWANEKLFNGSIWPSIILHGTGNFIGYFIALSIF